MKRVFTLLAIAGMLTFVACGPSAKEKAAEQAKLDSLKQDSIMKAEAEAKRIQDSIAAAQAAAIEKAKQDSIAKAAEAKKAKAPKKAKK